VLGAGYGGLSTVVNLQKTFSTDEVDIVLINKNDYHYESTWLHEASAGTLSPEQVRYDIRSVINESKVQFIQAKVEAIDVKDKVITSDVGTHTYDYLVISLGFEGETFGIPGLDKYALSIANVKAARQIRDHIEYQFASWSLDEVRDDSRLTIIVGGAGFTGIEFLGELGNRVPELCKEYDVPHEKVRVLCVEAAPMVLPGFDPELVKYAVNSLEAKGIEFSIGTPVVEATPEGVKIKTGEEEFEFIKEKSISIAGLTLRIAWIYRDKAQFANEKRFLSTARNYYLKSYSEGDYIGTQMSEARVLYMIAELASRIGDHEEAVRNFSRVMEQQDSTTDLQVIKLAKERWQEIKWGKEEGALLQPPR